METKTLNPEQQPPANNAGFTKRPVEGRFFDSALRDKLQPGVTSPTATESDLANFYRENKIYFWAIIAGLAVISVLAYFALRKAPPQAVAEAKINIRVDAPQTVASGGEEVYKITVDNQDSQKLVQMEMELVYPDGESYISSTPKADNLSGTIFAVPDLISGQNATLFVKTRINGSVNDSKKVTMRLHYHYNNFNSEFIKEQQVSVQLVASDVSMELSGPQTTNNAQIVLYTLKYQNNSDQDIKNARIQFTYPDGFNFASSDPQPDLGNNIWKVINTLPKGASATISIQGTFSSANPGESKTLAAVFQILSQSGDYFVQSSANFVTNIGTLPLVVSQSLDQQGLASAVVKPGDTIRIQLKYQNNSTVAAQGVNIVASLDSSALDLSTIQAEGAQISGNTISWNASSVSNLETLAPNESGNLSFSVRVKNPATKDSSKNLTIVSHVKIKSNAYETYFPGSDVNLKIYSPSSLDSGLVYSSGQLPPQQGKDTLYTVTLTMKNATNDFSNTTVTAFIPLGAGGYIADSSNDKNNVTFDPSTGKLIWNAGSLPAHTGQFTAAKTLTFSVRLNPSSSQVGQSPVLVKNIVMDAKDVFTGEAIKNTVDDIRTSDLAGQDGYQNGQVRP